MTVADYTETPFARVPRLHHKDAAEGPSSAPLGRRNLVGMMGVMMASGAKADPYHGYISDGLVAYWDGIDNVGLGDDNHSSDTLIWKDLSGNYDATFNGDSANRVWHPDHCEVSGSSLFFACPTYIPCVQETCKYTAEAIFKGGQTGAETTIVGCPWKGNGSMGVFRAQWWKNMIVYTRMSYGPGRSLSFEGTTVNTIARAVQSSTGKTSSDIDTFKVDMAGVHQESIVNVNYNYDLNGAYFTLVGGKDGRQSARSLYCCRIYNRVLSDEELLHNQNIDIARYGVLTEQGTIA